MPHLLIDRIRSVPSFCGVARQLSVPPKNAPEEQCRVCTYLVELLDICGALVFMVGSVCFFPVLSQNLDIFLAGCSLFILGAAIYLVLSAINLAEALREKDRGSWETHQHFLYFVGSFFFLVGTILYWPSRAQWKTIEYLKGVSPVQYFNLFPPELEGTLLFILGSVVFAAAAFINGVNETAAGDTVSGQLLRASTSLYMAGSLLFVVSSFAFLPSFGLSDQILGLGAAGFLVGSAFYFFGGIASFARKRLELRSPELSGLLVAASSTSGPTSS